MKKLIVAGFILALVGCGGGGSPTATSQSCTLKNYVTDYPKEYLGSHSIPIATDRFDNNISRIIGVKDYYPGGVNTVPGGMNSNCSSRIEYARLLYNKTLNRLKSLNVDTVEIYQFSTIQDFSQTTWTINNSGLQIPPSELIYFVDTAHSLNLKVTLVWQLHDRDDRGNTINNNNPTSAEALSFIRGWRDILLNLGKFSSDNKIDNLNIQWSAYWYPTYMYPELFTTEFVSIVDSLRTIYKGKLFVGWPRFYDKRLIEKVDAIVVTLSPSNWSYIDDNNMSVSLLKSRYLDFMTGIYLDFSLYSGMNPKDIPIIWDLSIQSRDKALSQGWVEDGFCIASVGGAPIAWGSPSCMQTKYVTDFSIQALVIEGAFQAIKEQNLLKTYGVSFSTGYWHTDSLVPSDEGFPNISQSIRGKPAENIVKQWFSKI